MAVAMLLISRSAEVFGEPQLKKDLTGRHCSEMSHNPTAVGPRPDRDPYVVKQKSKVGARVTALVVEDGRSLEAGIAVSPATVFALPRVFAAIAESAVDAAAPVAASSPDPLAAEPPWRAPVLAAAEVFGAPVAAARGVALVLAGAYCPTAGYR